MREKVFTPRSLFDRFLTYCRYRRVYQVLNQLENVSVIYDLGCGSGHLIKILCKKGYDAFGVDIVGGERIIAADLNHPLPLASESVDLIISLANIEHLHEPLLNLKEIHRVLRKQGKLILTTPSTAAKPVLEWLAFTLKLIDPVEILDHKTYFSKKRLSSFLAQAGFDSFTVSRFQCGMNLHAIAIK